MTYGDYFARYMTLYKRDVAPKTRESYARLAQLIGPTLDGLQLDRITPDDLQLTLCAVEDEAGPRQAQLAYSLLHAVFRRAVRSWVIDRSPVDGVDRPHHDAEPGRAISVTDWATLRPVIDGDICYALMAYAGLRRGELLALRRGDISDGFVHVRRQRVRVSGQMVERAPKSRAGARDVPVQPDLARVLGDMPLMHPRALMCPVAPETLCHHWRRDQLAAGVATPYRLHDLRHTYATRLVTAGCSLAVVQYVLGHSKLDTTADIYTHISAPAAASVVGRLSLQ